jgi:hypothetical protein
MLTLAKLPTQLPYTNGLAVTKMVVFGGSVLQGNKLIIGPLAATWTGPPIFGQLGT